MIVGNKLAANTVAVAVVLNMLGIEFDDLADALERIFSRKGKAVVESNMEIAQRGYDYVFDAVSGAIVYALDSHDLTDAVLKELKKNSESD